MAKIVLIEQTNILKIRLEKLFLKMGFSEIITYNNSVLMFDSFLHKIGIVKLIVIDYDQYADEIDSLIKSINEISKDSKVKIVILTSKTDVTEMTKLFTKGIDDIVLKPFSDEILYEKLNQKQSKEYLENVDVIKNTIKGGGIVLSWCKDYEIGVEEIDKEHKDIIEHFEKLYSLMKEGHGHEYFLELIKFLESYVHTHFEHEEALQRKIQYTGRVAHKELHDNFKSQVEKLILQYKESPISNADLVKLNLFIKEWLINHILEEDKQIGKFVANQKV